jgi:hypothetical protein
MDIEKEKIEKHLSDLHINNEHNHKIIVDGFFGKKNKTVEEKVRCFLISKNNIKIFI